MSSLQEITRIKKKLEEASAERARQEGALKERKRALKDLCGTDDITKASKQLKKMQEELAEDETALEASLDKLKERYADILN